MISLKELVELSETMHESKVDDLLPEELDNVISSNESLIRLKPKKKPSAYETALEQLTKERAWVEEQERLFASGESNARLKIIAARTRACYDKLSLKQKDPQKKLNQLIALGKLGVVINLYLPQTKPWEIVEKLREEKGEKLDIFNNAVGLLPNPGSSIDIRRNMQINHILDFIGYFQQVRLERSVRPQTLQQINDKKPRNVYIPNMRRATLAQ